MQSLPDEQNKLLKEMGDLDAQERAGILPVRSNLNLLLIVFTWTIAIVATILNVLGQRTDGVQTILIMTLVASAGLIISYYNKVIGYYLAAITFLALNLYITYTSNFEITAIIVLFDSLVVFVFANEFGRNGFILGLLLVTGKLVGIFFWKDTSRSYDILIAEIVNIFAIGIIPVLMLSISKVSRKAKKAEIRAEILSLQNQDLIGNWGTMFDRPNAQPAAPDSAKIPSTSTETFAQNSSIEK